MSGRVSLRKAHSLASSMQFGRLESDNMSPEFSQQGAENSATETSLLISPAFSASLQRRRPVGPGTTSTTVGSACHVVPSCMDQHRSMQCRASATARRRLCAERADESSSALTGISPQGPQFGRKHRSERANRTRCKGSRLNIRSPRGPRAADIKAPLRPGATDQQDWRQKTTRRSRGRQIPLTVQGP